MAAAAPILISAASSFAGSMVSRALAPKPSAPPPPPPPPVPVQQAPAQAPQERVEAPSLENESVKEKRDAIKRAAPKGRKSTILTTSTGVAEDSNKTTLLGG